MSKRNADSLQHKGLNARRARVRVLNQHATVVICEADAAVCGDATPGSQTPALQTPGSHFKGELHVPDPQTRRLLVEPTLLMETEDGRRAQIVIRFLSASTPAVAFHGMWLDGKMKE